MQSQSLLATGGQATPSPAAPGPNDGIAAALYAEPPPPPQATAPNREVTALRAERAKGLYSDLSSIGPAVVRELALATNEGGEAAELDRQSVELAAVAADIGMDANDVSQLASFVRQMKGKAPTAGEQEAFHRTAERELRERFGEDVDQVRNDVRRLTQRDPRFAAYVQKTHLGNHPWLVLRMADLARTARARGQLK